MNDIKERITGTTGRNQQTWQHLWSAQTLTLCDRWQWRSLQWCYTPWRGLCSRLQKYHLQIRWYTYVCYMDKNLPKIRTLPSMLVALKRTIWYGILAPATAQLPSLESKSSVESTVIQPALPPVTRNTWTQEWVSGYTNRFSYPAVSSFYVACACVT